MEYMNLKRKTGHDKLHGSADVHGSRLGRGTRFQAAAMALAGLLYPERNC